MYYALLQTIIPSFLYIRLLLYIENIVLLALLILLLNTSLVHIWHLLELFVLDIAFVDIPLVHILFSYLVFFYKFLILSSFYINLLHFLYIPLSLILPTIQPILYLYFYSYNLLSFLSLLLCVHLDFYVVFLIYLLMILMSHHIFLSIYILFFYVIYILLMLLLLRVYKNI